jgi:long-chain fatty acid transport protein
VSAPAIIQHHITMGFGYEFHEGVEASVAHYHALENEVSGPLYNPMYLNGQEGVPQSDATSSMFEDSFVMQFSFRHN